MLYLIGLGLGDIKDITIRGLECIKSSEEIYLECYTSLFIDSIDSINSFTGKNIKLAPRDLVENNFNSILERSLTTNISLLVIGDPLSATTHCQLLYEAKKRKIPVSTIHNASIMSAVACTGLQLYRFGETVSIVQWTTGCQPDSFYYKMVENYRRDLHTLCLLDIKIKELTLEGIMKNKKIYQQDYLQNAQEAAFVILKAADRVNDENYRLIGPNTLAIVCSRIGWQDQKIKALSLNDIVNATIETLGDCPHSIVIPAKNLHPCELDFISTL